MIIKDLRLKKTNKKNLKTYLVILLLSEKEEWIHQFILFFL